MFIYGLRDPHTKEMRYIGLQSSISSRLVQHLKPSSYNKKRTHLYSWIKYLVNNGFHPEQVILAEVSTREELIEAEKSFIAYFRTTCHRLCNHTDGGEGTTGYIPTDETRKKLRDAILGKRTGPNHPLWGKTHSETARQKMKSKKIGFRPSESHIKKIQNIHKRRIVRSDGQIFDSIASAARCIQVTPASIGDQLSGRIRTCKHFTFKYL